MQGKVSEEPLHSAESGFSTICNSWSFTEYNDRNNVLFSLPFYLNTDFQSDTSVFGYVAGELLTR